MWRIWYADGAVITGETPQDWADAPGSGVVGVAVCSGHDEYGRRLGSYLVGSDWYWLADGDVGHSGTSSDVPSEWLPANAPEDALLKSAEWVANDVMENVQEDMIAWAVHG